MTELRLWEPMLTGSLQDRWRQYYEHVRTTLYVIENEVSFTPLLFACESAMISGEDPERIPWPEKIASMEAIWEKKERIEIAREMRSARRDKNPAKLEEARRRLKDMKFPIPQWVEDFNLNDTMIADSCINSKERRGEIMNPIIPNMSLCRLKMEPKWRTSTYLGSKMGSPSARHVKHLAKLWEKAVLFGVRRLLDGPVKAPVEARQIFAWAMHDVFISFQPFKDGNERTARVMIQLIRRELDLPPVFISQSDMTFHRKRIRLFRTDFFLPLMRAYRYIDDL